MFIYYANSGICYYQFPELFQNWIVDEPGIRQRCAWLLNVNKNKNKNKNKNINNNNKAERNELAGNNGPFKNCFYIHSTIFIANIGGSLGLCTGFSLITGFEMVFFCTCNYYFRLKQGKEQIRLPMKPPR
jgi:hypothetical protein